MQSIPSSQSGKRRRGFILVVLVVLLTLCWSGHIERIAKAEADQALKRVVVAFSLSRTLNGLISVAQGTEIALQPAGVGVTLTAGELLDPLNDLVERFSVLALGASISLGGQMLLAELLAAFWVNAALTVLAGLYILTCWVPALRRYESIAARTTCLALFVRLVFAVIMFSSNWLGNLSLTERHSLAMAELTQTQTQLKDLNQDSTPATPTPSANDGNLLDRMTEFFDEQRSALDVKARLAALQDRAEASVNHLVTLSVIFLLQYLVLPIGSFWLASAGIRSAWQYWLYSPERLSRQP